MMHSRDDRQQRVYQWAVRTFGVGASQRDERLCRFFEEALEFVQACGVSRAMVNTIVEYVYSRPVGEARQEAGAAGLTLLAACEVLGFSADDAERAEFVRALSKDPTKLRDKQNVKAAAGVGVHICACRRADDPGACACRGVR